MPLTTRQIRLLEIANIKGYLEALDIRRIYKWSKTLDPNIMALDKIKPLLDQGLFEVRQDNGHNNHYVLTKQGIERSEKLVDDNQRTLTDYKGSDN